MTVRWQPLGRRQRVPQWLKDFALVIVAGSAITFLLFVYGWFKQRGWA